VDETIHHYYRAARELWKFCWSSGGSAHPKLIAHLIDEQTADGQTIDWWQRGTPTGSGTLPPRAGKAVPNPV
jgi:hypothetical protein